MRIWSLHPEYLDTKGLVALWRETLLARKVLEGKTKGYKNHPQLMRFKVVENPIAAIDKYLFFVWEEARSRNYNFDKRKFQPVDRLDLISLTQGQLAFEKEHLLGKLATRDKEKQRFLIKQKLVKPHPIFRLMEGEVEDWEKT